MAAAGGYGGFGFSGADAKGRFTLPVDLRHVVREESGGQNVLYLQHEDGAGFVHGYGEAYLDQQNAWLEARARVALDRGEPFNRALEKMRTFGNALKVNFDDAGRFAFDDVLREMMGVSDSLCFIGAGDTFMVWQPAQFLESGLGTEYQRRSCAAALKALGEGSRRAKRAG